MLGSKTREVIILLWEVINYSAGNRFIGNSHVSYYSNDFFYVNVPPLNGTHGIDVTLNDLIYLYTKLLSLLLFLTLPLLMHYDVTVLLVATKTHREEDYCNSID